MTISPLTELYFIRHGIAAERGTHTQDEERPLTEKGRSRTQQVAQRLKMLGCEVHCILSSPLVRAQQTTEVLLQIGISSTSVTLDDLAPSGHLQSWLTWLEQWQRQHVQSRLALVGHEPNLSSWAQHLVTGQTSDRWILKKAGVIGVQVPAAAGAIAHSHLFWLAPPRLLL